MKTVFHTNIDGFEVVRGFGEAFGLIDPVATSAKIAPDVARLPEQKQLAALNAQVNAKHQEAAQILSQAERARQQGDAHGMQAGNVAYQMKLGEIAEIEKQIDPAISAFKDAYANLWNDKAEYAHPPDGETLIDVAQATSLGEKFALRGDSQQLTLAGEYVADLRGRDFYLPSPWRRMQIDMLAEELPAEAILPGQLTDAQRVEIAAQEEADRMATLSPDAAKAEADAKLQTSLAQAARMRSELEIQGDPDALSKSQAWYAEQLTAVAKKYATTAQVVTK